MNRNLSFDNLKGLAIILVVFIHVNVRGFSNSPLISNDYIDISIRQLANFAVPLFLFASGYFMANKHLKSKTEYFNYLIKQLPRVLIPFLIWTMIYSIYNLAKGDDAVRILKNAIKFQATVPFYFILLICQYYILQPIILWLGRNIFRLSFAILISLISAYFIHFLRNEMNIDFPTFIYAGAASTWFAFPVLGAYVNLNNPKLSNVILVPITIIFLAFSIYISIADYNVYHDIQNHISAVKASSFLYSISAILFLYNIFNAKVNQQNLLTQLGLYSFGIYFSHMLFLNVLNNILDRFFNIANYDLATTQIIITISIVCIGWTLGYLLHLINTKLASKYLAY